MTHEPKLIKATGTLHYYRGANGGYKLEVRLCKGIGMFYRSLIPKWFNVLGQRYEQHISVVRKETPKNLKAWGIHEGKTVTIWYDPENICHNDTYWWLNVFSLDCERLREELGLKPKWSDTPPLPGFGATFHTTLGNTKGLS